MQHDAETRGRLEIRLARPERDAAAVADIYRPYVTDTHVSFETDPRDADEMALRITATLARYPWLVADVADGHHRRGIGSALYRSLFERLVEQGFVAYAGICLPNPASVALHERMGFRLVGTYEGIGHKFGHWWDVSWYHRLIAPRSPDPPVPSPSRASV